MITLNLLRKHMKDHTHDTVSLWVVASAMVAGIVGLIVLCMYVIIMHNRLFFQGIAITFTLVAIYTAIKEAKKWLEEL